MIARLLCYLFGHKWTRPAQILAAGTIVVCQRCKATKYSV